jgi:hypothetical protein
MIEMMMFALIQWGVFTAALARPKHRNVAAWFLIGGLLPLVGIVVLLVLPALPAQRSRPARMPRLPERMVSRRPLVELPSLAS